MKGFMYPRFYCVVVLMFAIFVALCSTHGIAVQYPPPQPTRGIVSGHVQNVSDGVATIVIDQPAFGLAQGTTVRFVLNDESMIFDGVHGTRTSVAEIQNYHRARVQYVRKGDKRVAVHIRLYEPVQAATSQPATLSHMAEAQAHISRGDALYAKGDPQGSIAEYRKALALDPNYVNAHNNLGNALDKLGKHDEAIQEYQVAIRVLPPYALAHHNLAIALSRKGDSKGAAEQERLACAFDPQTYCPSTTSPQDACAIAKQTCHLDLVLHRTYPNPNAFGAAYSAYQTCVRRACGHFP
jgi:TPR repeat